MFRSAETLYRVHAIVKIGDFHKLFAFTFVEQGEFVHERHFSPNEQFIYYLTKACITLWSHLLPCWKHLLPYEGFCYLSTP